MQFLTKYIIIPLLFLGFYPLHAQDLDQQLDAIYGLNAKLYNGRIHSDFYTANVKGHQFFIEKEFQTGDLEVNHELFSSQMINYDVYKQKVLLSFQDQNKANRIIEIPMIHLNSFRFYNKYFTVKPWQDSTFRIFQQVGDGSFQILIYWFKELKPVSTTDQYNLEFADSKKTMWVLKNGSYFSISRNKSFIKLFPQQQQADLKKWMKSKRIKIQKSEDTGLQMLVKHCETL